MTDVPYKCPGYCCEAFSVGPHTEFRRRRAVLDPEEGKRLLREVREDPDLQKKLLSLTPPPSEEKP